MGEKKTLENNEIVTKIRDNFFVTIVLASLNLMRELKTNFM